MATRVILPPILSDLLCAFRGGLRLSPDDFRRDAYIDGVAVGDQWRTSRSTEGEMAHALRSFAPLGGS